MVANTVSRELGQNSRIRGRDAVKPSMPLDVNAGMRRSFLKSRRRILGVQIDGEIAKKSQKLLYKSRQSQLRTTTAARERDDLVAT